MFITALSTIASSWQQPKCSLTDEKIKKMWYICAMKYFSAIKRNETESFVVMWMDLYIVCYTKWSCQKQKTKSCILIYIFGTETLGDRKGQGSLVRCSPWGRKEFTKTCYWTITTRSSLQVRKGDADVANRHVDTEEKGKKAGWTGRVALAYMHHV